MTGNQCGQSSYTQISPGPLNSRRFPRGFPGVVDTLYRAKQTQTQPIKQSVNQWWTNNMNNRRIQPMTFYL